MIGFIAVFTFSPETITAICAVVISFISLIIAISNAIQNRRHNRLTVRPFAYVWPPDYENRIAVTIQNRGTGPLLSRKLEFIGANGEKSNHLIDLMPTLESGYFWSSFSKASKIVLRPSDEIVLLDFRGEVSDPVYCEQRDEIRRSLAQVRVLLEYVSIYDEPQAFKLDYPLSWFGRNH